MKPLIKLFSLLVSVICCASFISATELIGVVKSESGTPIFGVRVYSHAPITGAENGFTIVKATTDKTGAFKLSNHGRIIYFKHQDLRPLTKVVELSAKRLEVAMQDAASSTWKLPLCSEDKLQRVGFNFMVKVPDDVVVEKGDRFGNEVYFFGYYVGEQSEVMVNWTDSTSDEPGDKYLLDSTEFSERLWTSGKTTGYETRGVMSNGQLWRRISFRWGAISYQGNSKESAKVFDKIMDNMCFIESEQR